MKQSSTIDYLKAFAIILIVFYHATFLTGISYLNLNYICLTIGLENVHVPLFLLIAGYLCHKQPVKEFYVKKLRRILIPFLFMSALKLILNNILGTQYIHGDSLGHQLYDAFLCGQLYWFCYCLLILFLISPLLWERKKRKWILLIMTVGANVFLSLREIPLTDVLQLENVVHYCPYFLLGMLLYECHFFRKEGSIPAKTAILAAAAVLIGGVSGYLLFRLDINNMYLPEFFFGLSVMALFYLAASRIPGESFWGRQLKVPGIYSLQIMLLDPFFRIALHELFRTFLEDGLLMALLLTAANVILCCLVCRVLRNVPVISSLLGLSQINKNALT